MEEDRSAFKILTDTLQEIDLQEGLGVDERTIIRMDLKEIGLN